jgi:SSS family solute:Na+ symporter
VFPSWFAGFAYAAIAIGALVPAAVMSIGAANLFTRNVYKSMIKPNATHADEASVAKLVSLVVKLGALLAIIFLPTEFAIDLQLLGGLWILQTFPSLVFGLFTRTLNATGLFAGWAVGMGLGTALAVADGLKPVHQMVLGGAHYGVYTGLLGLIANLLVSYAVSLATRGREPAPLRA